MRISKGKKLYGSIIAAIILCMGMQVYAVNDGRKESEIEISAVSEFIEERYVSDEYIAYIESGSASDDVPAMQDYTYLSESYDNLAATQNSELLPSSYDMRTEGLITPVVNQANLGVCWTIGVAEALTSCIIEQFPQESVSALPLAYFSYAGNDAQEFSDGEDDPYMSGGNDILSVATLASWTGLMLNSTYYSDYEVGADVPETYSETADYYLQDAYYMHAGYYGMEEGIVWGNVEVMKSLLMQELPITMFYTASGEGSYYNEVTYAYSNSEWDIQDHEVLIIGWDDNYAKENFDADCQPENDGAWLVQNSWGTSWGDEGCFWISYEDPTLSSSAVFVLQEADNYTTNYGYDRMGWCFSVATSTAESDNKIATAANIFTAEGNEQIEAVSFYTTDTSVKYTISIYTNLTDMTDPTSGTIQLENYSGTEAYAGYHTIELTNAIALQEGELFSIVVTLENATYDAPLAIETCLLDEGETEPTYLGNGGESYVLVDEEWQDIAGISELLTESFGSNVYITNVCIKAFTNALPDSNVAVSTVDFSEMEGPVADGTTITLEAGTDETIYYSVNGGAAVQGSTITVDFETISEYEIIAYAVDEDGNYGNNRTKTYTQASAQLVNLALDSGNTSIYFDTEDCAIQSIVISNSVDSVQIMAQSSDTISIYNGTAEDNKIEIGWELDGLWSESIPITAGETLELDIVVSGTGKIATTYKIEVTRGVIEVDWEAETITYDEEKYIVTDEDGDTIESGGSVTYLINTIDVTALTVTNQTTGKTFTEELPARLDMSGAETIDYESETTYYGFSSAYYYSTNADMSDATQCINGKSIALTPGEDMYIQRFAEEGTFASVIVHIETPERPEAPVIEIAELTTSTIKVVEIEGAIYRIEGADWQYEAEFAGLEEGSTYLIEAELLATDSAFASEVGSLTVTTLSSEDTSAGDVSGEDTSDGDTSEEVLDEEILGDDANADDLVNAGTTTGDSVMENGDTVVDDTVVDTGDSTSAVVWATLILVSLFAMYVGGFTRAKRK